jgi:hypothetical protein
MMSKPISPRLLRNAARLMLVGLCSEIKNPVYWLGGSALSLD